MKFQVHKLQKMSKGEGIPIYCLIIHADDHPDGPTSFTYHLTEQERKELLEKLQEDK